MSKPDALPVAEVAVVLVGDQFHVVTADLDDAVEFVVKEIGDFP